MSLILISLAALLFLWTLVEARRESMIEVRRFNSRKDLSYLEVALLLLDKICSVRDLNHAEVLVGFIQGFGLFIASGLLIIVWMLCTPITAAIVSVLALALVAIMPRCFLVFYKKRIENSYSKEVPLAAFLMTLRARPDESARHILEDVADSFSNRRSSALKSLFEVASNSFRFNYPFFHSLEKINQKAPYSSIERLSDTLGKWYSDAEGGYSYLEILSREQESVYQLVQDYRNRLIIFSTWILLLIMLLVTVIIPTLYL